MLSWQTAAGVRPVCCEARRGCQRCHEMAGLPSASSHLLWSVDNAVFFFSLLTSYHRWRQSARGYAGPVCKLNAGLFCAAEAFPGYPGRSGLHQIPQTSRRQAAAYAVVAECDPRRDKSMRRVSSQTNRNCWSKAWIKRSTRLAAWCFRHRFPQDQNRRIAFGIVYMYSTPTPP